MPLRPSFRFIVPIASAAASACATDSRAERVPPRDPVAPRSVETTSITVAAQQGDTGARRVAVRRRVLTEAEQRVADGIVFAPTITERFVVSSRNKRLLVDVGRVDLQVGKDAELLSLVRRVSGRVGPLSQVTRMRVRGTWGEETDSIIGYDVWNGRAVAVLEPAALTDSLLKKNLPLVGVATRVRTSPDGVATPPAPAVAVCVREGSPPALAARVALVRDSLVRWMADSVKTAYGRGAKLTVRGDTASGCFGAWRALVVVSARTPAFDWSEERALLVAADGKTASSRLRDLRLRTHEALVAFDADGDGIDELAARGLAPRMGAQTILKLDPATRRFSRLASGFAWESR